MSIKVKLSNSAVFNPDRPRNHLGEDELGRQGFVRSFWRALRNHDASEALVLSVQAPWGDGKTTFMNMVVNLEETEGKNEKLLFVHFNPWEWAAQDQVADAFFKELEKQIEEYTGKGTTKEGRKALASGLRKLPIVLGLAKIATAGVAMAIAPFDPESAVAAKVLSTTLDEGGRMAKDTLKNSESATFQETASVQSAKASVRKEFEHFIKETQINIVVFIDDIDRLSGDEIRQVLQLVKINSDFPGLIFVLLFDKKYVERRLFRHFGGDAASFLEKIVQVELVLPKASENQLYYCFERDVLRVLRKRPAYKGIFEKTRLREAFNVWLRIHLINPRRFGRLISAWAFRLDVFQSKEAEVNPVDLLILEGLALFEGEVYMELSKSFEGLFLGPVVDLIEAMDRRRENKEGKGSLRIQSLNRIAQKARTKTWLEVAAVLKLLLGVAGEDFSDVSAQETMHWIRLRRFSEARFFRRYFRLSIDSGDVSKAAIRRLVQALRSPIRFVIQLTQFENQGVLLDALEQLLAENPTQPKEPASFLAELLKWWELRILESADMNRGGGLSFRLLQLYEHILGARHGIERLAVLEEVFNRTKAVFALREIVFFEQGRRRNRIKVNPYDKFGILDESNEEALCNMLTQRLCTWFINNKATGQPYEVEACFWVLNFGGSLSREIGKELLKTPAGIITLIRGSLLRFGLSGAQGGLQGVPKLLAPIVEFEILHQIVRNSLPELLKLDSTASDWLEILNRSSESQK